MALQEHDPFWDAMKQQRRLRHLLHDYNSPGDVMVWLQDAVRELLAIELKRATETLAGNDE